MSTLPPEYPPMDANRLLDQIRKDVKDVQGNGQQMIDAVALDRYLEELGKSLSWSVAEQNRAHETRLAEFDAANERTIAQYGAEIQNHLEMFRSVIATGQGALRSAMLINGGAAVAILGFLSNAWSKDVPISVMVQIAVSMVWFASGVLLGAFAHGLTYVTQSSFAGGYQRVGRYVRCAVIAFVVMSYVAFAVGGWNAFTSLVAASGHAAPASGRGR